MVEGAALVVGKHEELPSGLEAPFEPWPAFVLSFAACRQGRTIDAEFEKVTKQLKNAAASATLSQNASSSSAPRVRARVPRSHLAQPAEVGSSSWEGATTCDDRSPKPSKLLLSTMPA